jgi:DNA-binding NarL/FixJ family response regulator
MTGLTRVAIADGDANLRDKLAKVLQFEKAIALVGAFESMTAAIDWLRCNSLDVLMTELDLPDGSGLKLIKACVALHPRCEVVVITSSDQERDVLSSIRAGASGYVIKDGVDHSNITEAAFALSVGEPVLSPGIPKKLIRLVQRCEILPSADAALQKPTLTPREIDILELIARGLTYDEIAAQLSIALGTVQNHIKSIYRKLAVNSRGRAVFEARKQGLLLNEVFTEPW